MTDIIQTQEEEADSNNGRNEKGLNKRRQDIKRGQQN